MASEGLPVDVVLIDVPVEIVGHGDRVTQALEDGVHVAGVAEVTEAR